MSSTAHVIRLGTAAVALHSYLREHDDGETSWTSDARLALAFLTADAARRYAARRLGGTWYVAPVWRGEYRRLMVDEEFDPLPEGDAGVEAALATFVPSATILTREQGQALAAHRAKLAAEARAVRRASVDAWRL